MKIVVQARTTLIISLVLLHCQSWAQPCNTLGQTPSTAFPVCGTSVFQQNTVPICRNGDLAVPGCPVGDDYGDKNPFYYKFTCYQSGTLGFVITPLASGEDYDWQLWDITGRNPNAIFTDPSIIVAGNWAGTYGPTGASASGVGSIVCASNPSANRPTFHRMPNLIQGHEYLLLVSHFTDGQSGYTISFGGGTAVITDPKEPHLATARPDCEGKTITLKLNKKMKCSSLTATGSEFSLSPAVTTIVSASTTSCATGFDHDEITLTLAAPLTNGSYQLIINNGSDANTLKDNCDRSIPAAEQVPFDYLAPQPIRADSIGRAACTPDSILIFYPKKIKCSTISSSGSDFSVSGPTPVTVVSAGGNCVNDQTDYIVLKLSSPIYTAGTYTVTIQPGIDGSPVFDLCGQPILPQTLPFITYDTVNADFQYNILYGCQRDTITFSHDGAHNVNSWSWIVNNGVPTTTQNHTVVFPATSTNNIQLTVSNGVCSDTASATIVLDNEVKADFSMPSFICPEDSLKVINNSRGEIDAYRWTFDVISSSNEENPEPILFPTINREAYYTVKLVVYNNTLGCRDSLRRTLTVLDHCLIEVPTAFTPNGDGLNDTFWPHNALKGDNYEFRVYNRWGQLVFSSRDWRQKWDGKINETLQTTGVFVWTLTYTHRDTKQKVTRRGTVTLIR